MGPAGAKLGVRSGERVAVVDAGAARAYAAATNDDHPAFRSGAVAPPVFAVVPAWDALVEAVTDVVAPDALPLALHGEQDMHFHRPLVPGRTLATTAEVFSVRVGGTATRYTVRLASRDAGDGGPVVEQYVTLVVRGVSDGASAGPDKPGHGFPEQARARPVGTYVVHVDRDQPSRYAEASGDRNPIHLDEALARSVGLPGVVVHGLCALAMATQPVLPAVAGDDPTRLRRLAARFTSPVFPGDDLVTTLYDAGDAGGRRVYAFEAHVRGRRALANGRAEVVA